MSLDFDRLVFGWWDHCMFLGLLGISLLIGIYFGFFSKQDSVNEYLFGGKSINYFPVAISILVSCISGIALLGIPTEVYQRGSQVWAAAISMILVGLIMAYVAMPVFFNLQVSSSFEYLERRFSKNVRTFSSILYIFSLLLYMPVVIFIPALAFSQVTGHSIHLISPLLCAVCIFYTSMGGVKAVVWTDTIQFIFLILGTLSILVLGIQSVGGVSNGYEIANEGGRLIFFEAIFLLSTGWGSIQIICTVIGLLIYAKYHDCDPKDAKLIGRYDQILPFYVMDIAGSMNGLPGIFLAGLTSSALATMSACLNTLSGTIYDTLIDPWIPDKPGKEAKAANIMKSTTVMAGITTIGMILVIEQLGTVYEISMSLTSVDGPLLGLFLLGMLFPWVGKKGAMVGACSSLVVTIWLIIGQQWYKSQKIVRYPDLPMSIDGCLNLGLFNATRTTISKAFTSLANETLKNMTIGSDSRQVTKNGFATIYRLSMVYFTLIGTITAIIVGLITSFVVGEMDLSKVDPEHISPAIRRFFPREKFYSRVPPKEAELVTMSPKPDITAKVTDIPDLIH
ncbi:hypothetical protein QAD02_019082 [Eretmocerus hayati]|uniref:Uncharacterized protein n=1 Tax=Eretmocerus hayati TaxID=131215 RepID=A0ACC2PI71_9HYME|nr:hypothetical protein QAD02_019082 [Eretmocerus hayati]